MEKDIWIKISELDQHQIKSINKLHESLRTATSQEKKDSIRKQLDSAEAALGWSIIERVNSQK